MLLLCSCFWFLASHCINFSLATIQDVLLTFIMPKKPGNSRSSSAWWWLDLFSNVYRENIGGRPPYHATVISAGNESPSLHWKFEMFVMFAVSRNQNTIYKFFGLYVSLVRFLLSSALQTEYSDKCNASPILFQKGMEEKKYIYFSS